MKTLETVYWIRFGLGIVAALLSFGYGIGTNQISSQDFTFNVFLNTMSLAIIVYLLSYYAIKHKYAAQLQKTSKLFTAGIGIYFLSWIAFWTLFYTVLAGV